MIVDIRDGFDYVPEWNNNKELEKKDQVVVHFKFLCGDDVARNATSDKNNLEAEWFSICKSIDNLTVDGVKVTPEYLFNKPGLASLYKECYVAFKAENEIEKKS